MRWKQNSSNVLPLDTGVPQGSSLGPFLFSLYIAPLSTVINSFSVSHHQYADDTQIFIALSRADVLDKVDMRVQNTLARVVLRRRKFEHITSALKELHWLPVQYRVTFRIAVLVHLIKNTGYPAYLRQLQQDYEPVRSLRSSTTNLICKTATGAVLASHGFRHSAVYVWNNLPDNIREAKTCDIFKRKLKTHLCRLVFDT